MEAIPCSFIVKHKVNTRGHNTTVSHIRLNRWKWVGGMEGMDGGQKEVSNKEKKDRESGKDKSSSWRDKLFVGFIMYN